MEAPAVPLAVVSPQPFHMFDLAREMTRRGWQVRLITATPRHMVPAEIASNARIGLGLFTVQKALRRTTRIGIDLPQTLFELLDSAGHRGFLRWSSGQLDGIDLVDALSGWGSAAGRRVQNAAGFYVCNRGSTHIRHQVEVVREEHLRWGCPWRGASDDETIAREVEEYALADAIVVPSTFCKTTFVEAGVSAHKVFVCPYGVSLEGFSPRARPDDDVFRVGFVGSASIRKGIGYLLEAMRPLVASSRVEVWIVGAIDPAVRPVLQRYAGVFEHRGFIPHSRLADTFARIDVMVLPSIEEGLALVQAQALACGVPIIVTPQTGALDLIVDGVEGFVVPARDPRAIRERVEALMVDRGLLARMGEAARALVRSRGGWSAYGDAVETMYRTLLTRGAML